MPKNQAMKKNKTLKIKYKQVCEILNQNGLELILLTDNNEKICAKASINGGGCIITQVNQMKVELYLNSRITLQELFLLQQDEAYVIIDGAGNARREHFEVTSKNKPKELDITGGNILYNELPKEAKIMDKEVIMSQINQPLVDIEHVEIETLEYNESILEPFTRITQSLDIICLVSSVYNVDQRDYLVATLHDSTKLMTCIEPQGMQLYLDCRITLKELFVLSMDKFYYEIDYDKRMTQHTYSEYIISLIDAMEYSSTYYNELPKSIRNTTADINELFDLYSDSYMISGKGVGISPKGVNETVEVELKAIKM